MKGQIKILSSQYTPIQEETDNFFKSEQFTTLCSSIKADFHSQYIYLKQTYPNDPTIEISVVLLPFYNRYIDPSNYTVVLVNAFSSPMNHLSNFKFCKENRSAMVVGTLRISVKHYEEFLHYKTMSSKYDVIDLSPETIKDMDIVYDNKQPIQQRKKQKSVSKEDIESLTTISSSTSSVKTNTDTKRGRGRPRSHQGKFEELNDFIIECVRAPSDINKANFAKLNIDVIFIFYQHWFDLTKKKFISQNARQPAYNGVVEFQADFEQLINQNYLINFPSFVKIDISSIIGFDKGYYSGIHIILHKYNIIYPDDSYLHKNLKGIRAPKKKQIKSEI